MNLTKQTIDIVKQTAPILRDKGEEITTCMYKILFSRYPETEPLFRNAAVNQNVKLAEAITAYAENIDQLDQLTDAIERMAQRHVHAGVKPEHYQFVADALMSAIVDVLGTETITDEVITAWTEAYNYLADILKAREAELYSSN